jgi:hypothetical protein
MKVTLTGSWPEWVLDCSSHVLRAELGSTTYQRGLAYAQQRRVQTITADGDTISSVVRGSNEKRYQTSISGRQRLGHLTSVSGLCSCPMSAGCKHVAATLVLARDLALKTSTPQRPAWESQLAGLLTPAVEKDSSALSLALQLEVGTVAAGARGRQEPTIRIRPVTPGKSGKWVKTGVGWRDLEYGRLGYQLAPRHREVFRSMLSAYRSMQPYYSNYGEVRMTLADLGPSAWGLLQDAEQLGVPLVSTRSHQRVQLTESAEVVLDVSRQGSEGVQLAAALRIPGEPAVSSSEFTLVGSPAHGAFRDSEQELLLVPFDTQLDSAVHAIVRGGGVTIPEADVPVFTGKYYPAMRQRVTVASLDGSVELPEVQPPCLLLRVTFAAGHESVLEWSFAYPVGGSVITVTGADEPVARDRKAERALLDTLPDVPGLGTDPAGQRHLIPRTQLTGMATALFVRDDLPRVQALEGVVVEVVGEPSTYQETDAAPIISVGASDSTSVDWFDLTISVSVAGQDVPLADLIGALVLDERELLLPSGTWFSLDRPELASLQRIVEEARALQDRDATTLRLSPYHAGLWEELVELGVVAHQSARWTATVDSLLSLDELPRPDPPRGLQAELRPYQLEGYHWLSLLWDHDLGGILADDMGLGKTVQTLAMAARGHEQGRLGGAAGALLVVAPTSVVGTWATEAARFTPGLAVVAITETAARSGLDLADRVAGADIVVTSYALFRIDNDAYERLSWCGLVLDEAQFVKNHQALTYQCARRLPAPFKLAITGTPLENSLMDLWSMLSITAPGLFPNPQRFTELYRRPIESGADPEKLAILRRRIRPLLLRRTKDLVARDLPPKVEQVLSIPLNPQHRKVYDQHLARERQRVLGLLEDLQKNRITILSALTKLRQLSLDASLVDAKHAGKIRSSKIDALMEQLPEVIAEGHRVLVFSQFTGFLALVRARLTAEGIPHVYLDGRTRKRPARIA